MTLGAVCASPPVRAAGWNLDSVRGAPIPDLTVG
jgi:hypothetical protein